MSTKNRIAIVNYDKCKPHKCKRECERFCPVNLQSFHCVTHEGKGQAKISEDLCTGCNICTKKCPFDAINIINLPTALGIVTHRYGENGFQLYGLPMPEKSTVLGLIGCNGIGKSTALLILIGKLMPNMGNPAAHPTSRKSLKLSYRGTNIQNYLNELDKGLNVSYKPQNIQDLRSNPKLICDLVPPKYCEKLELKHLTNRTCDELSDGELQRIYLGICMSDDNADVLILDEPCTYLDIYQRMAVSRLIRECTIKYKIVVEHDFMAVDYMADKICILYGQAGCYGNVTMPLTTAGGLNSFLDGFITYSNTRFRPYSFDFKFATNETAPCDNNHNVGTLSYPSTMLEHPGFSLNVNGGTVEEGKITVLLGKNGSGKTTFIDYLRRINNHLRVAYKPQNVYTSSEILVRDYLKRADTELITTLNLRDLMERPICTLSGGERQKVSIAATLSRNASIYLIDEPSVYLDVEAVLIVAKLLKRFATNRRKYVFVVEHDLILGLYLTDSVILFELDDRTSIAHKPRNATTGFNDFLKMVDTTVRRDQQTHRPRINKYGSVNDTEQKSSGNYICSEALINYPEEIRPIIDLEW